MTQELQREKSVDEDPELEELLDMEEKVEGQMSEIKYNRNINSESLLDKTRRKLKGSTEQVKGKVESVQRLNDRKIRLKISYNGGSFTESFHIYDSNGLNGNSLYKLLDYKGVRDGQFLDLRGEYVPIDTSGSRQRVVVPERKGKLSDSVFKFLQKSRKYKLVRSRFSKNMYQITFFGYLVSSGFIAPVLFATGNVFSATSSVLSQGPVLSILSSIFIGLSVIFNLVATFVSIIFFLLATGFGIMLLLFLASVAYRFIRSRAWPF